MTKHLPIAPLVVVVLVAIGCTDIDTDQGQRVVVKPPVAAPSTTTTTSSTSTTTSSTTTTTTTPARRPRRPSASVGQGGAACGGDLPPCSVCYVESRCTHGAVNPTGCGGRGCYTAWQFDPRTWAGVRAPHPELGLPAHPADATPAQVDAAARALWANGAGCSHWNAC